MNCISHSRTLSICTALRSDRSSYRSLSASFSRQKVARPRDASRPAKTPYGPSGNTIYYITIIIHTILVNVLHTILVHVLLHTILVYMYNILLHTIPVHVLHTVHVSPCTDHLWEHNILELGSC